MNDQNFEEGNFMDFFGVLTMLGGLALFLYGMETMGKGLEKLSGGRLERILEKLTSNPIKAVLLGAVTHAGFTQRAVEDHPEAVGLRVGVLKIVRGTFRPHGMGGRGAFAGFVNFTDRFHGGTSKCLVFTPENRRGFLSRLV